VDAVAVEAAGVFFFQVAHPGFGWVVAECFTVEGGREAEAAFHPALEHGTLRAVGIKTPAFHEFEVAGAKAMFLGVAAFVIADVQAEYDTHVALKTGSSVLQATCLFQQAEQAAMGFMCASDAQALRVFVEFKGCNQPRRYTHQVGGIPALRIGFCG